MGEDVGMERVAGAIDAPTAGSDLDPRDLRVEGWAYDRTGRGASLQLDFYLDDHWIGRATPSHSRPDVAQALDEPEAELSGFELHVAAPPIPPGGRALLRTIVNLPDGAQETLAPVTVRFRPTIGGVIDLPAPRSQLDPKWLRIWGWAYAWVSPVSRVDVFLGDDWLGRASLGRRRPDVATALAEPDAELSGFELHVSSRQIRGIGLTQIRAVVTALDGSKETLTPVAVRIRPTSATATAASSSPGPPGAIALTPRRLDGPIRILWSARGLDQGGSQLRMAELVERAQQEAGFHSTVLSPTDGPLRSVLEAAGATVRVGHTVPFDDVAGYERSVARLSEWVDGRFDLVVGFTVTSFPAVDAAVRAGVPSVLRIGEAEPLRTVVDWLSGTLDRDVELRARRSVACASVILSNSHAAIANYRADGYTGRFVVLGTGVDTVEARAYAEATDREECRRLLGVRPGERLLLCSASLWSIKGQALLVNALGALHGEHPDLTCALVGLDYDGYAQAISSLIARRGLQAEVRNLPFDRDLRPWRHAADVAVCPSETEALPAAVLEAMASGLPALACRVGDLEQIVEPGVTGWLCDHSDLEAMIEALEEVALTSPERLRAMGAAAANAVARSHNLTEVLDRSTALLGSVAQGRLPDWAEAQTIAGGDPQPE
jgi:glycosyltransferase involved in cell wall biosynthesis